MSRAFKSKSQLEWLKTLDEADVPSSPVNNVAEVLETPQIHYRKIVVETDVPELGRQKTIGSPFKFSHVPDAQTPAPPPTLGDHTVRDLQELLGYSEVRIAALKASEAI